MRCQPALYDRKGRRVRRLPLPSCVPPEVRAWVADQCREFDMSASWVVATALSFASGIDTPLITDTPPLRGSRSSNPRPKGAVR